MKIIETNKETTPCQKLIIIVWLDECVWMCMYLTQCPKGDIIV